MMIALMAIVASGFAQRNITGKVVEKETQEALAMATVKLMKTDSTLVKGGVTTTEGNFKLTAPENGRYILKVTTVGFKSYTRNITISEDKDVSLGKVALAADAIMLKGATVTANVAKVTVKEDTFVYNAAAYRTPEGSVVEELVKRLPGAQVSDDGKITINGKEVKKILVDGKEFMTGDTKTAMKNLPTSIVEKVKAYDEKSDLARVSGIDDGDEQTVLDFGIKKGMNKGMFSNIDLAGGTNDRYAGRGMAARFNDTFRMMGFLNANNVGDKGFPGGGGRGGRGGGNGLNASKMAGFNMNYEKKDKFKLDGSARWNHSDGDVFSKSASENFISTSGSFSNSQNKNMSRSNSFETQFRIEWMPDSMTNIMFRPTFTYSENDSWSKNTSATYNDDPYLYVTNPLEDADIARLAKDSLVVNRNISSSISNGKSTRVGGSLQVNRKLSNTGRNLTLRVGANYNENTNKSFSLSDVDLYLRENADYSRNRFNLTPTKSWNYNARITYSEPIMKATFLQFSYNFKFNTNKSDRSTYDFSDMGKGFFDGLTPGYGGWDNYLSRVNATGYPWESFLDDSLSRYSEYKTYTHDMELQLRIIRKKYNFNIGVNVVPQNTKFVQNYYGVNVDTTRHVVNITPTADFRWKISKVSQMRFVYRGSTGQPSMSDLLSIRDDSNPLNITEGNPGLKPSFTNDFRFDYNNFIQKWQRAIMVNGAFSMTSNDVSNNVTYDPVTGGRTSRPENINGNWNARMGLMFNTAIDTTGRFYTNTWTNLSYNHRVSYLNLDNKVQADKNNVNTFNVRETLTAGFRNDWLEFELTGTVDYANTRNKLQPDVNMDTWDFSYGWNANIQLPWGMTLATDMGMNSRRGYSDASMNTNELIWNAQLAQSFLKGKPLTVSLQFYDILKQQSNISRSITAFGRSDSEYNKISSYAMLHVIYRMNLFGGKEARREMRRGPGGPDGPRPGGPGMRGGGFGRGGFGGGRPF